jgi:N-acyl-D-amino-acid deacylase
MRKSEDRISIRPAAHAGWKLLAAIAGLGVAFAHLFSCATTSAPGGASWIITGAEVADGTGGPLRRAQVRVVGDRIEEVGALTPREGEHVIAASGLVLAPGFIDIHNHSSEGLTSDPAAETQVSQGITTLVLGPDGESPWPISAYLEQRRASPAAVNVMTMVGHATVRERVMGKDYRRAAKPEEVVAMAALVDQGMREGAVGVSSGLEYDVGSYSETSELVALGKAAARYGGFYMTHIRDEADKSFEAFAEAIRIGKEGGLPVQISHIKLGTVHVWGRAREAVRLFEEARAAGLDVTADCYPYTAWHANIEVLVPNKKYDDPESVARALDDVGGAKNVTITNCRAHPDYAGRDLAALAASQGITPVELFIRVVRDGGADVIGHSMQEADVETFYRQPWVMVGSDGGIGSEHPRGAGTFPKVLGRYVRERKLFSLAEAVRKMTALPAARLKLADRGRIAPGMKADLVLFDPMTVIDRSTFENPGRLSVGIRMVAVNGRPVWENAAPTGATPGRVLPERDRAQPPADAGGVSAARVDAIFSDLDSTGSPGCALAVVRDGKVVYQRGYGMASLELAVPITPRTVFDIGSTEKQFAATAMLLLQKDGKLALSDDIRKYLPEIPDYGHVITIDDLLRHTSGLRDYIGLLELAGHREEDVTTDEDALYLISRQKGLDFPPGSRHRYSNTGYFLLSQIVRRVTGVTLGDFARDRILQPLGMSGSLYLDDHTRVVPGKASSYASRKGGGFHLSSSNWEQTGDGGLQTTVLDLARWDRNFYAPIVGDPALVEALQTPGTLSNGHALKYARGLRVEDYRGLRAVSHGGAWAGFRAQLLRFPQERLSTIVLCNVANGDPVRRARQVADLYLEGKLQAPAPRPASIGTVSTEEIARWSGLYLNQPAGGLLKVRGADGKLLIRLNDGPDRELLRIGPNRFVPKDSPGSAYVFSTAGAGEVRFEDGEDLETYRAAAGSASGVNFALFQGRYDSKELDATYRLFVKDGALMLRRPGAPVSKLVPQFADVFLDSEIGLVRFTRSRASAVTGLSVSSGASQIPFDRVSQEP